MDEGHDRNERGSDRTRVVSLPRGEAKVSAWSSIVSLQVPVAGIKETALVDGRGRRRADDERLRPRQSASLPLSEGGATC